MDKWKIYRQMESLVVADLSVEAVVNLLSSAEHNVCVTRLNRPAGGEVYLFKTDGGICMYCSASMITGTCAMLAMRPHRAADFRGTAKFCAASF
jgi:hypothetical protein